MQSRDSEHPAGKRSYPWDRARFTSQTGTRKNGNGQRARAVKVGSDRESWLRDELNGRKIGRADFISPPKLLRSFDRRYLFHRTTVRQRPFLFSTRRASGSLTFHGIIEKLKRSQPRMQPYRSPDARTRASLNSGLYSFFLLRFSRYSTILFPRFAIKLSEFLSAPASKQPPPRSCRVD